MLWQPADAHVRDHEETDLAKLTRAVREWGAPVALFARDQLQLHVNCWMTIPC